MTTYQFPENFLWGAATASYQIEGAVDEDGRGRSIWDTFSETPGNVTNDDKGAVACDHYHLYKNDVQLMKQIGLQAYRFSIAWSRILPQGIGEINQKGLGFYDRLVDELLANGIQPWATLYHWDLPQGLEDYGGWANRSIVDAYVNYADVVTRKLGDRVKHWMTFNEPWVFTFKGYASGGHAPGGHHFSDFLHAAHHMLLSHARAYPVIHANSSDAKVGIVCNLAWSDPATDSEDDLAAVQVVDGFYNRWFLDPLFKGNYPEDMADLYDMLSPGAPEILEGDMEAIKGAPDFLGINYYFRFVVTHDGTGELEGDEILPDIKNVRQPQSEYTEMGWEVSPQSIHDVLTHTYNEYHPKEIFITENGAAFDDQVANGDVHDLRRVNFYQQYLANCHRAVEDGIPLKGYLAGSLMDHFEWAHGYTKRFGITYVDFETQERILKSSGKWYRQTITNNGFELD
jgi:beta-glucosidase